MTSYRIYWVGPGGQFICSRGFASDTDAHAIEWARQQLEDQPIELRSGERLVKRLSPDVKERRANPVSHEVRDGRMVPKSRV